MLNRTLAPLCGRFAPLPDRMRPATASAVVIPSVPGGAARIWIYRNDYQYEPRDTPYVWLNGRIAGVIQPNAAFYRDVPPAQYTVTVDSYGVPYPVMRSTALRCSRAMPTDSAQKATFVLTIAPEFGRVRYVSLQTSRYEAGFEQCYAFWPTGHCS